MPAMRSCAAAGEELLRPLAQEVPPLAVLVEIAAGQRQTESHAGGTHPTVQQ